MSSSSQNKFLSLAPELSVPPVTSTATTAPSRFLSLIPEVSASHPTVQRPRAASSTSSASSSGSGSPALSATLPPAAADVAATLSGPNTSSAVPVSSMRVLKLSPVHWGAHAEDDQADYVDI